MSKFYVVRGPGGLPARAIISRVCAARRSAGNGRSIKRGRSSVYIAEKAIFKGALLFPRPVHRVETVALFSLPFWVSKKEGGCGWMPFILLPVAPFLLTSFSDERSKTPRRPPLKIQQETSKKFLLPFCFPKRKQRRRRCAAAKSENQFFRPAFQGRGGQLGDIDRLGGEIRQNKAAGQVLGQVHHRAFPLGIGQKLVGDAPRRGTVQIKNPTTSRVFRIKSRPACISTAASSPQSANGCSDVLPPLTNTSLPLVRANAAESQVVTKVCLSSIRVSR